MKCLLPFLFVQILAADVLTIKTGDIAREHVLLELDPVKGVNAAKDAQGNVHTIQQHDGRSWLLLKDLPAGKDVTLQLINETAKGGVEVKRNGKKLKISTAGQPL